MSPQRLAAAEHWAILRRSNHESPWQAAADRWAANLLSPPESAAGRRADRVRARLRRVALAVPVRAAGARGAWARRDRDRPAGTWRERPPVARGVPLRRAV